MVAQHSGIASLHPTMSSSASQLDFVTIDVFTNQPYEGNPLAVVRIPHGRTVSQEQKQTIAREFNLSETTFLHERDEAVQEDVWAVDIFMTTRELPFAGHPTVGTACYILGRVTQERGIQTGVVEAEFKLKAGPVGLKYDVAKGTAKASIPHDVSYRREEIFELQPQLAVAQQQNQIHVKEDHAIVSIVKGMTFILIELESMHALEMVSLTGRSVVVDGLDENWKDTFVGTYFFVRTGKRAEGVSTLRTRMIEGQLEDPATGSAASGLAAFLSLTEGNANEALKFHITQGVEMGRRSEIFIDVELASDRSISKVYLEGGAVAVMEGRLRI
ncbi:similar to phenazine biosynthesis protein PhzF family [Plenodomus lingam JN3]|uniref:Similar to phenazine biosynthesis protein PhzF family n=1 Tax=Leptosphaeria maculans (strain JN3 / isolate v23.1.3 / race Av1-4-5-6-7-8) TaxID=985895 RepID=E5AFP8_LEPMJ|nr:similar to phenazine biosynthesis protein PhzF family [Plenodomus lingam JN3]CBY02037.1 similar to phenazine biosynthesis protein PhzF family [Plenodomus lingam JN3]